VGTFSTETDSTADDVKYYVFMRRRDVGCPQTRRTVEEALLANYEKTLQALADGDRAGLSISASLKELVRSSSDVEQLARTLLFSGEKQRLAAASGRGSTRRVRQRTHAEEEEHEEQEEQEEQEEEQEGEGSDRSDSEAAGRRSTSPAERGTVEDEWEGVAAYIRRGQAVWSCGKRLEQAFGATAESLRAPPPAIADADGAAIGWAHLGTQRAGRVMFSVRVAHTAVVELMRSKEGEWSLHKESVVRKKTHEAHFGLYRLFTDQLTVLDDDDREVGAWLYVCYCCALLPTVTFTCTAAGPQALARIVSAALELAEPMSWDAFVTKYTPVTATPGSYAEKIEHQWGAQMISRDWLWLRLQGHKTGGGQRLYKPQYLHNYINKRAQASWLKQALSALWAPGLQELMQARGGSDGCEWKKTVRDLVGLTQLSLRGDDLEATMRRDPAPPPHLPPRPPTGARPAPLPGTAWETAYRIVESAPEAALEGFMHGRWAAIDGDGIRLRNPSLESAASHRPLWDAAACHRYLWNAAATHDRLPGHSPLGGSMQGVVARGRQLALGGPEAGLHRHRGELGGADGRLSRVNTPSCADRQQARGAQGHAVVRVDPEHA